MAIYHTEFFPFQYNTNKMIEIKQFTNIDELYKHQDVLTGNILVDAVVEQLRTTCVREGQIIAERLDVDNRMLSKAMEKFVGLSLHELIVQWRVRQAVDLLDNPALSLEDICQRTGYQALKSLSSAMMKYFGTTPTIYREGTITVNGGYTMNMNRSLLREAQANAQLLHQREWRFPSAIENS